MNFVCVQYFPNKQNLDFLITLSEGKQVSFSENIAYAPNGWSCIRDTVSVWWMLLDITKERLLELLSMFDKQH